jgi:hypothetical protein
LGLTICVGFPPDIRESDPDYVGFFERQFETVNEVLESFGLPRHEEPFDIEEERTFESPKYGYDRLHYLRRLAAHLALKGELPPPGDGSDDPVLEDYNKIFDASLAQGRASGMPFQHLIVHSDGQGFYLPVEFDDVLIPDASLEIAGEMIGSSHALLRECRELARALEMPESLSFEEAWEAAHGEGEGEAEATWERYGVESYACLGLIRACEASVETGAAVVFA